MRRAKVVVDDDDVEEGELDSVLLSTIRAHIQITLYTGSSNPF